MKYSHMSSLDIFEDLCDKIKNLVLEPGTKISENEMATFYNVSRSTIRTAFSKLEQINLIEIYPQIGTLISPLDMNYIYNAMYVRNLVEMDVLEDVINMEDKRDLIHELEGNLREQERFRGRANYENEFKNIDTNFHNAILKSVGKDGMIDIIKDSYIHIARWRNFDIRSRKRLNMLIDEHGLLVEAIKNNDIKTAKKIMKKHLLNVNDSFLIEAKREYPNYF